MDTAELWEQLISLGEVISINVVLSGDNAIVVGMAAAAAPLADRRKIIFWGLSAAMLLRVLFALVTAQLLAVVGLTLAGGLLLLWVCWKMFCELRRGGEEIAAGQITASSGTSESDSGTEIATAAVIATTMGAAVWRIVVADVSMSLDNVLAVAGAAKNHPVILVIGLVMSVAMLGAAANFVAKLLSRHRWLGWVGLAIITYVACSMILHGSQDVLLRTS